MNRLALLCSGQGAQTSDMLDRFTDSESCRIIDERLASLPPEIAARILKPSAADLQRGEVTQPALCLYAELAWKSLDQALPKPHLLLGYSLGELVAYAVSGVLAWEKLPVLALERARLMAKAYSTATKLVAVKGLSIEATQALCQQTGGAIAIFNGPDHFVIGMEQTKVERLCQTALSMGAGACCLLPVEVASHTSFLASAEEAFLDRLRLCHWGAPNVPVLSATSISLVRSSSAAVSLLARQLAEPVRWSEALEMAIERGTTLFLELGPGSALTRMVRELHPEIEARSFADFQTAEGAIRWCVGRLN